MFLETERLILRKLREEDFEDFCAFAMDDEMCRMMGRALMPDKTAARLTFNWLANCQQRGYAIVLKETGRVIGNLSVTPAPDYIAELEPLRQRKGCAMSFSLGRQYWRRGLMTEAVRAVIDRLFNEENVDYINCGYFDFNEASRGLQQKLGFEHLMTLKVDYDGEERIVIENILLRK